MALNSEFALNGNLSNAKDLKSKAINGSIWSLIETFSLQIVQFIVGIVLARILEPKDFGLIAITGVFTGISSAITDGGFEKTLIQKDGLTNLQVSSIFYLNIFLGLLMTLLLILFAPAISNFFDSPDLIPILEVISLGIFLNSLSQTQQTLLLKTLNFKKISRVKILTAIIGGITGLILAITGFGVWALVYASLIPQVFRVIFFWIRSSWYPMFNFSFSSIKALLPYGFNILISSIFFFVIQQFNVFMVGKFYSKSELGLFNRGNRFPDLVISVIETVILKMSMPIFSKLQNQKSQLVAIVQKTNKMVAFVSFPLLILLFINAEDITIFLFTEKWRGSIIFLQLFCVVKIFEPFITIHRELILSQGRSKLLLKIFSITSTAEICLIFWVIRYGIFYLVLATFLSRVTQYLVYTVINSKQLLTDWRKELACYTPYILITISMALIVWAVKFLFTYSEFQISLFWKLSLQVFLGIFSYGFMAIKFKLEEVFLVNSVFKVFYEKIRQII